MVVSEGDCAVKICSVIEVWFYATFGCGFVVAAANAVYCAATQSKTSALWLLIPVGVGIVAAIVEARRW